MFVFPWSNLHELNLDWILQQVKQFAELIPPMSTAVEDVQALQTDVEQAVEDANAALEDASAALETAEEAKEIAEQAAQGTIADGAVTTVKLDDDAVTTAKIADGAVTGNKIGTATIQTGNLSQGCVTTVQILDGTITDDDLGAECVTTSKLGSSSVTTSKINDSAVTTAKINDGAVTNAKLADSSVTAVKIADGTLTADKFASGVLKTILNYDTLINGVSPSTTAQGQAFYNGRSLANYRLFLIVLYRANIIRASQLFTRAQENPDNGFTTISISEVDSANTQRWVEITPSSDTGYVIQKSNNSASDNVVVNMYGLYLE